MSAVTLLIGHWLCTGPAYVVLTAVLCSADSPSADVTLGGLDSEFTLLPLVLVRGPVMLRDALFTWWQVSTAASVFSISVGCVAQW